MNGQGAMPRYDVGGHRSRVIISLTELFDKESFWCLQAWEMQYLPQHMAKFLRDTPNIQTPAHIPGPEEDKLTWVQVETLCGMVQPYPGKMRHGSAPTHLLVHQTLSIECVNVPGQVPVCV